MSDKEKIEIGDKCFFKLLDGKDVFGEVTYIPNGSGDCWHVNGYYGGKPDGVYYIQNFAFIHLREKAKDQS